LNDVALYDLSKAGVKVLEKKTWLKVNVKGKKIVTPRQMHTMTAVYSHMIDDQNKYYRSLWAYPFQPRNYEKD
jgi:hypothetical protein